MVATVAGPRETADCCSFLFFLFPFFFAKILQIRRDAIKSRAFNRRLVRANTEKGTLRGFHLRAESHGEKAWKLHDDDSIVLEIAIELRSDRLGTKSNYTSRRDATLEGKIGIEYVRSAFMGCSPRTVTIVNEIRRAQSPIVTPVSVDLHARMHRRTLPRKWKRVYARVIPTARTGDTIGKGREGDDDDAGELRVKPAARKKESK